MQKLFSKEGFSHSKEGFSHTGQLREGCYIVCVCVCVCTHMYIARERGDLSACSGLIFLGETYQLLTYACLPSCKNEKKFPPLTNLSACSGLSLSLSLSRTCFILPTPRLGKRARKHMSTNPRNTCPRTQGL